MTVYVPAASRPGPNTPAGKTIAARNATSHGLFARDVVLPHLGEDPAAYNELFLQFCDQLAPQNLLERHYVEKIAAASWRLRRLHRWQAQVYEDPQLTEDERITRLDKVLRQETTLHRQIDQTVRLLNRDVPQLFARRARAQALAELDATEADCKLEPELAADVERAARAETHPASLAPGFDLARLDNTQPTPASETDTRICENEPPPPAEPNDRDRDVSYVHPDGRPVYLQPDTWHAIRRMRALGEHERADEHEAHYRRLHLFYQTGHYNGQWIGPRTDSQADEKTQLDGTPLLSDSPDKTHSPPATSLSPSPLGESCPKGG